MKTNKFKLQRGFLAGVIAVAVVALVTAGVINQIGLIEAGRISNDLSNNLATANINYDDNLKRCTRDSQTEKTLTNLTASEKATFGQNAKAYNIKINERKASFRLVVGAKKGEKVGDGIVEISYGLTFKDFVTNTNTWGGNDDRMIFLLTNGVAEVDIYDKIEKNVPYTGKFKVKYPNDQENIKLHIEFQGKNYDGCVKDLLNLPSDLSLDTPPSASPTTSPVTSTYEQRQDYCLTSGHRLVQITDVEPTASEKRILGDNVKAYGFSFSTSSVFRLAISAKESDKRITFPYIVTYKGSSDKWAMGFTMEAYTPDFGGSVKKIPALYKNQPVEGEFNYSRDKKPFNLHIQLWENDYYSGDKRYFGCLTNLLSIPADLDSTTPDPSPTVSVTPPTPVSPTPDNDLMKLNLKSGFNAIYLPDKLPLLSLNSLLDNKLLITWAYNRDGSRKWSKNSSLSTEMYHDLGYYVNNLGTELNLGINDKIERDETIADKTIYKGWNLLANSSEQASNLSEMKYALDPCPDTGADLTCQAEPYEVKLSNFKWGIDDEDTAFGIFIVDDPYSSNPDKAFKYVDVDDNNASQIEIPAGKLFWMYIWP